MESVTPLSDLHSHLGAEEVRDECSSRVGQVLITELAPEFLRPVQCGHWAKGDSHAREYTLLILAFLLRFSCLETFSSL